MSNRKNYYNISVFGSHHPPSSEVKDLINELAKIVACFGNNKFAFYHGGGGGIMKELATVANKFGIKSIGIGTREYHENSLETPRTGDDFIMADNIFDRVRNMVASSWLTVSLPEGGGGTEFETLGAFYALRTLTFREKNGEKIPFVDERRLIAMGDMGKRLNEHISLYNLWKKSGIKNRVIILNDNRELGRIIKKLLLERLAG